MDLHTALMTIISVMASLTGLGFIFNLLLVPVKEINKRLEVNQDHMEQKIVEIKNQLSNHIDNTNKRFEENDKIFRSFGNLLREIKAINEKRLEKSQS